MIFGNREVIFLGVSYSLKLLLIRCLIQKELVQQPQYITAITADSTNLRLGSGQAQANPLGIAKASS